MQKKGTRPSVTDYPNKIQRKAPKNQAIRSCIINVVIKKKDHYYIMCKRPDKGLLAGLWEFPNVEIPSTKDIVKLAGRGELVAMLKEKFPQILTKSAVENIYMIGTFDHVFSHIKQKNFVDFIQLHMDSIPEDWHKTDTFGLISSDEQKTLSTGVRKALSMIDKFNKNKKITQFFKS